MKIKNLNLTNFAGYDEVSVSFDDNVTYLIGGNGAGKSTLGLTAIWFMFKGIYEKSSDKEVLFGERFRFIRDHGRVASGEMTLYDTQLQQEIKVIRKLTKDGTFLSFEAPEGVTLNQQWLDDLFNIFLINPKKFCQLNSKEQAIALGINTEEIDQEITNLRSHISGLHTQKKSHENTLTALNIGIETTDTELIDVDTLKQRLKSIEESNHKAENDYRLACNIAEKEVLEFNNIQDNRANAIQNQTQEIERLKAQLANAEEKLSQMPKPEAKKGIPTIDVPTLEDTTELKQEIERAVIHNSSLINVQTAINLKKSIEDIQKDIELQNSVLKEKEQQKITLIKNSKLPSGVTINDKGELLIKEKPLREPYFSTGELVRIVPVLLSTQNPELKFVFLQDFNNLDEENRNKVTEYLTGKGFQLVIELIGDKKIPDKNCILLKGCQVIDETTEEPKETLF